METDKKPEFKNPVWVVMRDRKRVSDMEYKTQDEAQPELQRWVDIVNKWCGVTKVYLEMIESRKQRDS